MLLTKIWCCLFVAGSACIPIGLMAFAGFGEKAGAAFIGLTILLTTTGFSVWCSDMVMMGIKDMREEKEYRKANYW